MVLAQEARDKMEYEKEAAEKRETEMKLALEEAIGEAAHLKALLDQALHAKSQAEHSLHEALTTCGNHKVSDDPEVWSAVCVKFVGGCWLTCERLCVRASG